MFDKLRGILKDRDLRKKILYVLFFLLIFRALAAIPIPTVDPRALKDFLSGNQFLGLLSVFSGGALDNLSIMMLGVGPYITASIIMQLLTMIFPQLKEMYQEEGEIGKRKFNQYSRMLTVPLALLQGYALLTLLTRQGVLTPLSFFDMFLSVMLVTAGSVFLTFIGEIISEYGIGNGVSILIFAGIVSRIPASIQQSVAQFQADPAVLTSIIGFIVVIPIVVAGVVFITEGERPIPVSYAKRVRGMKLYGGVSTYLPIRVNQAGVIPIIFAISILLFPQMIGQFLAGSSNSFVQQLSGFLINVFNSTVVYGVFYFLLVFLFTYFYTAVTFDPEAISNNLQKQGGFIPGIRPGRPTAEALSNIINRITLVGGIFLGLIAVLPLITQTFTGSRNLVIGGTALLIAVSVVIEIVKQIQAQLTLREYE